VGIFITFMLRVNVSPVAPILGKELNLTDFQLGIILGAFLWVYAFLQPVAGIVADRFGAKITLLAGVLATSIVTILTGFSHSFTSLVAMRVIVGAAQAPNFVTGAKVSSSAWYEQDQRGKATSIWITGGRLGPALTTPFAAWLAVSFGWQWAFFGTGLIGLLWCVAWYFGFKENPRRRSTGNRTTGRTRPKVEFRRNLPILISPLALGLALASFGQGYVAYYLNLWLPTYLVREQKFTVLNAGIFSAIPLLSAVVTLILVGGFLSDYLVRRGASPVGLRRNMFSFGMASVAVMLFLTAGAPDPISAVVLLSVAGAMWGFSTPSLWVALVESTPKELSGTMGGLQNFGGNLAGIVVTILTGYILEVTKSFFMALLAGSGAALLASASALIFIRPKSAPRRS